MGGVAADMRSCEVRASERPLGDVWAVQWAHGAFEVHARGGMLGGTRLKTTDGREVAPFYEAPWLGETGPVEPRLLAGMRNEFPCAPFGGLYETSGLTPEWQAAADAVVAEDDAPLSDSGPLLPGHCGAGDWRLAARTDESVSVAIHYPQDSPSAA